jgi:hypothetical protein
LKEIERQRKVLARAKPKSKSGKILARELDLAAQMAEQSCKFMLWQQAVAAVKKSQAKALAQRGVRELRKLEKDFIASWPLRNKATTKHCSPFLKWRIEELNKRQRSQRRHLVRKNLCFLRLLLLDHFAFTSHASRRPSPRKFNASSVVTSTPPGKTISHQ